MSGPRERMIVSAALLIRERGAQSTAISDVLAHSGAPRGSAYHHFPGGRTEFPEFFLAFMVQTGNNQFFVYINTTTNVVNFIHINTSGSYLRHGTLSFVSLLYVLSPEMAGQMVVQMRVPEINLAHGLQAQAANDLYRYF